MFFITMTVIFCCYAPFVVTESHCVGTCYSGPLFPEPEDIYERKHLNGFSYKNITTDDPRKCYSSCVQDCRCKACQMKDARCELLDEDKTSKADNFVVGSGYVYYDIKQTMYQGKYSHMIPQGVCYNGCCRSQPCMNGGTCVEHCQTPPKKLLCQCPKEYEGKYCEKKSHSSCMDVLRSSKTPAKDGVYMILLTNNNKRVPMFCAFNANQAWTLIESFSLANNVNFKGLPFSVANPINPNDPTSNWDNYRMYSTRMRYVCSKATLFRATCDFPKRNASLTPDLLLGSLSDLDIIEKESLMACSKYKFIDIRGHQCSNCTAFTAIDVNLKYHIHIAVKKSKVHQCDFQPPEISADR